MEFHSALPQDKPNPLCCPAIIHSDYLPGGGKDVDEAKLSAAKQLQD